VAERYDAEGADELTFLDITATHEGRETMFEIIEATAERVFMPLTVGGGVRTLDDIRALLQAGADKVSINSAAVRNPDFIREAAERFGSQCIVVAIDAKRMSDDPPRWEIFTHGGRRPTGIDALEWAERMESYGAGEFLVTSMDRDGTKVGYDNDLNRAISSRARVPLIASGGAGNLAHLYDGFVVGGADAVLAASIFHYQQHTIGEAKAYLAERGVPVRLEEGT